MTPTPTARAYNLSFCIVPQQIGQSVTVSGTVVESRSGQRYFWFQSEGAAEGVSLVGAKLYVAMSGFGIDETQEADSVCYPAGSRLQVRGTLLLPQGQCNPGGFDERQWLYGNGPGRCGNL